MHNFTEVWTILTAVLTAILTYLIAIRGKRKDVDIEKEKNLNIVISDLLEVYHFLRNLERITDLKKEDLPFPPRVLTVIFLKSEMFNDACFTELQNSVKLLKPYDPVTYSRLNGIGERFNYLKSNYILPILSAKNNLEANNDISRQYINKLIEEIQEYLEVVPNQVSRKNAKKIRQIINKKKDLEEIKKQLLIDYYEIMRDLPEYKHLTFEEFKKEISSPEFKSQMEQMFSVFEIADTRELMAQVAEEPNLSLNEMKKRLNLEVATAQGDHYK